MRKIFTILTVALLMFACGGNSDEPKEEAPTPAEQEVIVDDAALQTLETTANELVGEAEELATEIDDLIENL